MDRTTIIIRYQWRAYWRRLRRGGKATAGNQGLALLILGLVFVRYLQWLRLASVNLSQGKTALLEALLAGLFVAWLFPLAGSDQTSIATRRWLHLPLSLTELFTLRIISVLMPPSSWIVVAASLTLCYPLLHAGKPFAGMLAGLLFVAMSGLFGLTVSHLIGIAFWRRVLAAVTVLLSSALGLSLIAGKNPKGLLQFATYLPSTLVARAAVGQRSWIAIAILTMLAVVAYATALWSFRLSLENSEPRIRAMALTPFSFPGNLGGLLGKDFRYFRRLLDVYLGLLMAAGGCVYLVTAAAPSLGIFLAFISIVFLLGTAVPGNSFGLDTRAGLDRYSLLPLSGQSIILSKNLAYLIIMCGQVLPLIFLAGWRLGISASACGLIEAAAHACAYLAWGNWMSVSHPLKMHFFRFASSGAALADALAGMVFGSLPGILIIYLLNTQGFSAAWKIGVVGLLFAALYWLSVARYGSRFEQKRETIGRALS